MFTMFLTYQRYDDFTIRVGLEVVRFLQVLAKDPVVVDLPVDCERKRAIYIGQGLSATICSISMFARIQEHGSRPTPTMLSRS